MPSPNGIGGTSLRARLEAAGSTEEVLCVALEHLGELDVYTAVSALYFAVKHGGENPPPGLSTWRSFTSVLGCLCPRLQQLQWPRSIARLLWALGKVEGTGDDADAVILHASCAVPPLVRQFSSQELSNSLWGLARLAPLGRGAGSVVAAARSLARTLVAEASRRIESLTPQCLSNSLWAVARLGLKGTQAEEFARNCAYELYGGSRDLASFSPQCLANVLWASAKLSVAGPGAQPARLLCAAVAAAGRQRLEDFQMQELSMIAWAMAKLRGRSRSKGAAGRGGAGAVAVAGPGPEAFLPELAEEARRRLAECTPQGISNIAWALATADVLAHRGCQAFLVAAAAAATPRLGEFQPQAISNLLWAIGRLSAGGHLASAAGAGGCGGQAAATVAAFAAATAREALRRMGEFGWQDLSGVLVALSHGRHKTPEAQSLAAHLIIEVTSCCHELSMQVMLNTALSAARLGLPQEALQPMVREIAGCVAARTPRLNDADLRQWVELQRYCQVLAVSR